MTENQGQDLEVRAVARRRTVALTAAVLMLAAVATASGLWAHSWAERGWLGFSFHGETFDEEDAQRLPDLWILQQQSFQVSKVHPGSPAARAGISPRDRVVSIAGIPVEDHAALTALDGRLGPGDEVLVEVARGDRTRRLELRLESPFTTPHTLVSALASAAIGLLYLVTGFVVYWARPRSRLAFVFALLSATGAAFFFLLVFAESVIVSPRGLAPGNPFGLGVLFWILILLVSFLLTNVILHLALIFPRRRPLVDRWKQIFHWVYAGPFSLLLAFAVLLGGAIASKVGLALQLPLAGAGALVAAVAAWRLWRARRGGRGWLAAAAHPYASLALPVVTALFVGLLLKALPDQAALVLFVVVFLGLAVVTGMAYPLGYTLLAILSMLNSYRESGVEEKRQVRWPLWGLAVCLLGTSIATVVFLVLPQIEPAVLDSTLFHSLASIFGRVFYAAIPLSFAFAIAKYRLMEVDLLVRKTLVYAATTTLIVGVYFIVVGLFGVVLVSWIDLDDPVVAVGTTLFFVALFVPVRNRLQRLVDRRFRRDGTDRREALEAIRRAVLSAADLDTLLPAIAETVQQTLQSRAVVLFVRPPDRDELVAHAKVGVPDEVIGRLRLPAAALAAAGRVTDRSALALDEETHGRLKRHRLHCVAPARRQGEVVGAVAAADSLAGDEPSADDREFLAAVADQLALAVGTLGLRRESVELDQARLLQRSLLPAVLPQPPGTDLAGAWHPAREVAGDYYEAIDFGGGKLALCIGDVVGKGMPAALLMSSLQAAVRAVATAETAPARLCEQVRRVVTSNLTGGRFVTFFYALYDAAERRLVYANAGHVPPILVRADGAVERLEVGGGGAFVRLLAETPFENGETTLAAGDRLVLFTDGVSEAQSPDGELYGEERLGVLLSTNGDGASAADLAERITADVRSHAAGDPDDDLTLLLLRAT